MELQVGAFPSSQRVGHFILFYFKVDFLVPPLLKGPISLINHSGDRINYLDTRLSIRHFVQILSNSQN